MSNNNKVVQVKNKSAAQEIFELMKEMPEYKGKFEDKPITVEEAAHQYGKSQSSGNQEAGKYGFKAGVEWQKEQQVKIINDLCEHLSRYSWGHYQPAEAIKEWMNTINKNK